MNAARPLKKRRCDTRSFEDLQIEILEALNNLTENKAWVNKTRIKKFNANENVNVQYVLKCTFIPTSWVAYNYHEDSSGTITASGKKMITQLDIEFQLVRQDFSPRPQKPTDGTFPNASILLCAYTTSLSKNEQGIFQANGSLQTNILNLPADALQQQTPLYISFEGRNFAKIVLNAAIFILAKTQVQHTITATAVGTQKILEGDSGTPEYSNFEEYADGQKLVYLLGPENYADGSKEGNSAAEGKEKDLARDEKVWQHIAKIAQHKFEKAISEDKFKVAAPLPSPYILMFQK